MTTVLQWLMRYRKQHDVSPLVALLAAGHNPNGADAKGTTPLHYLCELPSYWLDAVKTLVAYGADPMLCNCDNMTPIDQLLRTRGNNSYIDVYLEVLLAAGGTLNRVNGIGCAPLHMCCDLPLTPRLQNILLTYPVDTTVRDDDEQRSAGTVFHWIADESNVPMMQFLLKHHPEGALLKRPFRNASILNDAETKRMVQCILDSGVFYHVPTEELTCTEFETGMRAIVAQYQWWRTRHMMWVAKRNHEGHPLFDLHVWEEWVQY